MTDAPRHRRDIDQEPRRRLDGLPVEVAVSIEEHQSKAWTEGYMDGMIDTLDHLKVTGMQRVEVAIHVSRPNPYGLGPSDSL